MEIRPDQLFARMDGLARARPASYGIELQAAERLAPAVEPVYVPQDARVSSYRRIMRSHDRMGTRYPQK